MTFASTLGNAVRGEQREGLLCPDLGTTSRAGSTPCARRWPAPSSARPAARRRDRRLPLPAARRRRRRTRSAGCSARPSPATRSARPTGPEPRPGFGDADLAASSEETEEERTRLIALVELARKGDSEAFGMLYDHYQGSVYRFLFYRTRSSTLAEDLTSETFFRALRNMQNFRWQGKDFGAWLMTIARNLATDHFKAGRTRLEMTTEDMGLHDDATEGPEHACWPASPTRCCSRRSPSCRASRRTA